MKIYLKWTFLIIGPFLLIVGGFVWYLTANEARYSRDELDESFNEEQVHRLQIEKAEKKYLDQQWRKQNEPKTGR